MSYRSDMNWFENLPDEPPDEWLEEYGWLDSAPEDQQRAWERHKEEQVENIIDRWRKD